MQIRPISTTSRNRIIAANRILLENEMTKQLAAIYITHKDVSGPSLPGYSLDALCWAWLGWVVAFQGTGGDWLEPTHACLEILPPSFCISLFSPSHPVLSCHLPTDSWGNPPQEEKAASPNDKKKYILKSGHQRKECRTHVLAIRQKRKVRNRCRSTQLKSSAFVFVSHFI